MKNPQLSHRDITKAMRKELNREEYGKMLDNMVEIAEYKGDDPRLTLAAVKAFELLRIMAPMAAILVKKDKNNESTF